MSHFRRPQGRLPRCRHPPGRGRLRGRRSDRCGPRNRLRLERQRRQLGTNAPDLQTLGVQGRVGKRVCAAADHRVFDLGCLQPSGQSRSGRAAKSTRRGSGRPPDPEASERSDLVVGDHHRIGLPGNYRSEVVLLAARGEQNEHAQQDQERQALESPVLDPLDDAGVGAVGRLQDGVHPRRVPDDVSRDAGRDAGRCAHEALRHRSGPLRDKVGEARSGQAGEQDVAIQAATHNSNQERVEYRAGLVDRAGCGRHGIDEVRHILNDGEAKADHRAVHEAVHYAVELARRDQEDGDDAHQLERLLDAWAHDSGAPL